MKKIILLLICFMGVMAAPLSNTYSCPTATNELKLFRAIISNSTNGSLAMSNILEYFNVSEIYKTPILELVCGKDFKDVCKNFIT